MQRPEQSAFAWDRSQRPPAWHYGLVAIAALAAHWAMLFRSLLWDDLITLDYMHLHGYAHSIGLDPFHFFRPGKMLYFTGLDLLFGNRALGWQAAGLLLTVVLALSVLRFAREILPETGALFAALIYAMHPLHVEGAGWASAANGSIMTAMAIWCYLFLLRHAKTGRPGSFAPPAAILVAAMLMKEEAAVLPVIGLAFLWCKNVPITRRVWIGIAAQLCIVLAIAATSRFLSARAGQRLEEIAVPRWAASLDTVRRLLAHAGWFAWPFRWGYYAESACVENLLSFYCLAAGSLLIAVPVVVWAWRHRNTHRRLVFLLTFFVLAFAPVSNVLPLGNNLWGVRYLTHSGIAIALAGGLLLDLLVRRGGLARSAAIAAACLWLGSAAFFSAKFHFVWKDGQTFFTKLSQAVPDAMPVRYLAQRFYDSGRYAAAEQKAREALNRELRCSKLAALRAAELEPYGLGFLSAPPAPKTDSRTMLGMSLMKQGKTAEALQQWREALQISPRDSDANANLADYYDTVFEETKDTGTLEKAISYYRNATAGSGENSSTAYTNLGRLFAVTGRTQDAIAVWREGLLRFPGSVQMRHNLAFAEFSMRRGATTTSGTQALGR